jgi:hypothetical protein
LMTVEKQKRLNKKCLLMIGIKFNGVTTKTV